MILSTSLRIWGWGHFFFLLFGSLCMGPLVFMAWIPAVIASLFALPFFIAAVKLISFIQVSGFVKVAAMAFFSLLITATAFHFCNRNDGISTEFNWHIDDGLRGLYYASLAATFTSNIVCYRTISAPGRRNVKQKNLSSF